LALVAVAGVVGVPAARAEEHANSTASTRWPERSATPTRTHRVLGGAEARADELEALEKQADAERAEQAKQFVEDASRYGRRVEEIQGPITRFTEYTLRPPATSQVTKASSVWVSSGFGGTARSR